MHTVVDNIPYRLSEFASGKSTNNAADHASGENPDGTADCPDGGAELRVVGRVWRVHGSFSSGSSAGAPSLSGHWDWGSGSPFSSSMPWRFIYW